MSFSQEMKDFLTGYSTVTKANSTNASADYTRTQNDAMAKKTAKENSPEYLAHEDAVAQLALRKGQAAIDSEKGYQGLVAAQAAKLRQAEPAVGGLGLGDSGYDPAPYKVPGAEKFADGGAVPDGGDDDEDDGAATPANAAPTAGRGLSPQLTSAAHAAVRDGSAGLVRDFGLGAGGIRTGAQKRAAQLLQQGAGGLSPQEMEMARQKVDPNKELSESQRNMAALGSVYQFFQNKGEPDKAQRVAGQMLQHYRSASERYAAIAAHAAQGGDMPLAAKAAVRAYANVPDGKDFHIEASPDDPKKLVYYYTDENGKDIARGIATPQELGSAAMGLASGGFDKALLSAAGQREEAVKGKAGAGPKPADDIAVHTLFHDADKGVLPQMKERALKANPDMKAEDSAFQDHMGNVSDLAQHIYKSNIGKVTPNEAANYALGILTPGKADPKKTDFKVIPDEENGGGTVKFNNGKSFKLDDENLNAAMDLRAAKIKARADSATQDTGPGMWDKIKQGYKTFDEGAVGAVNTEGRRIKGDLEAAAGRLPEEVLTRGKSALEAAQRAGGDVKDYIQGLLEHGSGIGQIGDTLRDGIRKGAIPD